MFFAVAPPYIPAGFLPGGFHASQPTLHPSMAQEFVHFRRVEFAETDMAGIVHFANFFRWMESAEHAFLRSLGFSVHGVHSEGVAGWPRVSVECEYRAPLRFEQEVEVALTVDEIRNRSIRYRFSIRLPGGEPAALGTVTAVYAQVDPQSGSLKAAPIPSLLREKLEAWSRVEKGVVAPLSGAIRSRSTPQKNGGD